MNKRHLLDEAFRHKLRGLEAEAPMHLWEQINQKRDWKHRVLNQARQKKPLVGLFATLAAVGLIWGAWHLQQPALSSFPIPLATASSPANMPESPAITSLPSSAKAVDIAIASVPPPPPPTTVSVAAVKNNLIAAALPAAQLAETTFSSAAAPAVRPLREEPPAVLPLPFEEGTIRGWSIFDALFAPEPRCATFGNGSWKFHVDALISPDLAFRQLQPRDPEFEDYTNSRRETESNMYAFSGALRLSIVSDRGLALRTGINYSQINERFSYINGSEEIIETINNYDQDGNIISTDTIVRIGTRRKITQNHYRMLDIPFLLGYEMNYNKLNVSVNGGAYLNLLFRQKGDFLSPQDMQPVRFDSGDPDAYPAFKQQAGLGWYGSVGFAYQAGPNLQLVVEPHFKIFPKSVTRDQYGVQQRYMSTGLFLGVRQQL